MKDYKFKKIFRIIIAICVVFTSVSLVSLKLSDDVLALEDEQTEAVNDNENMITPEVEEDELIDEDELHLIKEETADISEDETQDEVKSEESGKTAKVQGIAPMSIGVTDGTSFANAVASVSSEDTIILENDITLNACVVIPSSINITVTSSGSNAYTITAPLSGRHFYVQGTLNLEKVTLNGNDIGGGIDVVGGKLNLKDGSKITHCVAQSVGGGVALKNSSEMLMDGGEISYNTTSNTSANGGGVSIDEASTFVMNDGSILNNKSTWGGGVDVGTDCFFTMYGGTIDGNGTMTTSGYGGGVHVYVRGTFTMHDGVISNNDSAVGAGVFVGQGSYVGGEPTDWCLFVMNGGTIKNNTAASYSGGGGGGIAAMWNGLVEIHGGKITGNSAYQGAGIFLTRAREGDYSVNLTMTGGEIFENNAASFSGGSPRGGGIFVYNDGYDKIKVDLGDSNDSTKVPKIYKNTAGVFGAGVMGYGTSSGEGVEINMYNAEIYENELLNTVAIGAGVMAYSKTTFTMYDGKVNNNVSTSDGGGVSAYLSNSKLVIEGGEIVGNECWTESNAGGGGILVVSGTASIKNTLIKDNFSYLNGGGVLLSNSTLTISDDTIFEGNYADWRGGAIYTNKANYEDPALTTAYQDMTIDDSTVFVDNKAYGLYSPPSNAADFTNLCFTSSSILLENGNYLHVLNNYDINYVGPYELSFFDVTYDANGGTGSYLVEDLVENDTHTVLDLDTTGIAREGYNFIGWNTQADGNGMDYAVGSSLDIDDDITLYAQWKIQAFTVNYEINDGSGVNYSTSENYNSTHIVLKNDDAVLDFVRNGYTFTGWNTQADGNGIAYSVNAAIVIKSDVTLYAQWTINAYKVSYDANGGTGSVYSVSHNHGTTHTVLMDSDASLNYFRDKHNFAGWNTQADGSGTAYNVNDMIMVTGNITLYAQWVEIPTTPVETQKETTATYKVEHHLQQADGSYMVKEVENHSGEIGTSVSATYRTYTGYFADTFHINTKLTGTIKSDDSLVLKLYYKSINREATFKPSTDPNANTSIAGINTGTIINISLYLLLMTTGFGVMIIVKKIKN